MQQDLINRWIPRTPAAPTINLQTAEQQSPAEPQAEPGQVIEPVDANVNVSVVSPCVVSSVTASDDLAIQVDEPLPTMSPAQLREAAEQACRKRDNKAACRMFDELASRGDIERYNHVSKLRHGISLRHLADGITNNEPTKNAMLERAVNLLEQAADHAIASYAAQALYEQSKALWRLWRAKHDPALLDRAHSAANRATLMVYEPSYLSWSERLKSELDAQAAQGSP